MNQVDRQRTVLNILQSLRNLDGLKKLFWEELNYEREIDERVYKLYGLTPDEIKMMEDKA